MPRTRPKSVPAADVLSSGSSDSGLERDVLSVFPYNPELETPKPFKFGADIADKDRMSNLQTALSWIRCELKTMKSQDKLLARTMIDIRSKIQQVKLEFESIKDTGYDSDEIEMNEENKDKRMNGSENDLSNFNTEFPVNGTNFVNNKRATWAE